MYQRQSADAISGVDRTMHAGNGAVAFRDDLRRALERQEFPPFTTSRLYRSPAVGLAVFEVLLAWQHPQREACFPVEFIQVAEEKLD